jgi:hypothetical protein
MLFSSSPIAALISSAAAWAASLNVRPVVFSDETLARKPLSFAEGPF